jgi:hypothetical protein
MDDPLITHMDIGDILMGIIGAGIGLVCAYFRAEYALWRKTSAADRDLRKCYAELYKNRSPANAQKRRDRTSPRIVKDIQSLASHDHVDAA